MLLDSNNHHFNPLTWLLRDISELEALHWISLKLIDLYWKYPIKLVIKHFKETKTITALRIRLYVQRKGVPLHSYSNDGIGTQNILFHREGWEDSEGWFQIKNYDHWNSVWILQSSFLRPSETSLPEKKTGKHCCTNMLNKPYLLSRCERNP